MGLFITFEGGEGSGKSTQQRLLAEALRLRGMDVVTTREPGGCAISDRIRAILLDAAASEMTSDAELLLYAAARAQHVSQVLRPALQAGSLVLCDRYCDATIAYQGHGRGLDLDLIARLNAIATGGLFPDLTLLIDCPAEVGLKRALRRISRTAGDREERFERENISFHEAVRAGYLSLATAEPERITVVDGTAAIAAVAHAIDTIVTRRLAGGDIYASVSHQGATSGCPPA
jgi:dTMP kinase